MTIRDAIRKTTYAMKLRGMTTNELQEEMGTLMDAINAMSQELERRSEQRSIVIPWKE